MQGMKFPAIRRQVTLVKILILKQTTMADKMKEVEKEIFNYDIPL